MDPAVSTPISGSGYIEDNNRIPDDLRCKRLDDTKGYMTPSSLANSSKSRSEKMHGAMTFSADVFHIDVPILYAFSNEMIANVDVLTPSVKNWVPDECYC
ncbi:hypothetical protein Tco_0543189 [Tanacetum coccineum]